MCRFKSFSTCTNGRCKSVSIHHMCRFKPLANKVFPKSSRFQYIICVGSRLQQWSIKTSTSAFQYIICVGSSDDKKVIKDPVTGVSIHHMCRFKYLDGLAEIEIATGFNTSYVSVQDTDFVGFILFWACFNTSYVSVQEFLYLQTLQM